MLFHFLLVAVLAASAQSAHQNSATCGERPFQAQASNRIVNGFEAIPGDWGWQVSLTNYGRHFCGGVLINSEWILTAGHCFQSTPYAMSIDLGLHDRNNKESWYVTRKSAKLIVHPQFNIRIMSNDIAMIKLSAPVTMDGQYIIEACMPAAGLDVQSKTGWVTGWGASRLGGSTTTKMFEVSMPILTDSRCSARYGSMVSARQNVCAGEFDVGNGACQGDSGGPFVVEVDGKWTIVGLTSWGQNGCGYGTVYTRVSSYLDWIDQQVESN